MAKRIFFSTVFLGFLIWFSAALHAASPVQSRIVILGDSLSASYGMKQSEGWVSLLQHQLNEQESGITLINESISGETTGGGLARLEGILKKQKPTHLLVELGGNDGLRGFPIKRIKNNLLQIIETAQRYNVAVWLMEIQIPPNYGRRYTQMFTGLYQKLGEQHKIPVLPFFMESIADKPNLMQNDKIHPNQSAQPLIRDFMNLQLTTVLGEQNSTSVTVR